MDLLTIVAWGHAVYYFVTGVWPVAHVGSFMAVTGPKRDVWLVKTVGLVIAAIGLAVGVAAYRGEVSFAIVTLGVASATALGGVDVWYWARRVIPKVYLLDAVGEAVLIVAWVVGWVTRG